MAKDRIFMVVGLGIFGMKVCEALSQKGAKVIAIDNRPALIERAKEFVFQGILLDTTNHELLKEIPYQDVDVGIVAIGDNIEASILTAATLKELGIPIIIARAVSAIHRRVLEKVGVDEVVNVEEETGTRLAHQLLSRDVLDRVPIAENVSIAEIAVPKNLVGMSLEKMDMRKDLNVQLCGVIRRDVQIREDGSAISGEKFLFPDECGKFMDGDKMLVAGGDRRIDELFNYISG